MEICINTIKDLTRRQLGRGPRWIQDLCQLHVIEGSVAIRTANMIHNLRQLCSCEVIAQPDLKPRNVSPLSAPIFLRYTFKRASAAAEVKGES